MLPEGPSRPRDLHVLGKMMTTSWSGEPFVTIRGHKEGHVAPHPRFTRVVAGIRDGPEGPSEVAPRTQDSRKRAMSGFGTVSLLKEKLRFPCF